MYRKTLKDTLPHLGAYLLLVLVTALAAAGLSARTGGADTPDRPVIVAMLVGTGTGLLALALGKHVRRLLIQEARRELNAAVPASGHLDADAVVVRVNHRYQRASTEVREIFESLASDAAGSGTMEEYLELLTAAEGLATPSRGAKR